MHLYMGKRIADKFKTTMTDSFMLTDAEVGELVLSKIQ